MTDGRGAIEVLAPFGLDDLFNLTAGANRTRITPETFAVKAERVRERWPGATVPPREAGNCGQSRGDRLVGAAQRIGDGNEDPTPMTDFPPSLLDGYRSFKGGRYEHDRDRYRALAEHGQTPEVMVIACCDSRAAPETIFSAAPGDLFVVRNVANLVPPHRTDGGCHGTSAALEFAVQGLKVRHIVVLGHGRCGGIRAALSPSAQPLSPDDFIGKWMKLLEPAARAVATGAPRTDAERQTALERASIRSSVANLRTFPCVSILESRGRLGLHGAWFDIAGGELWTMDPAGGEFFRAE